VVVLQATIQEHGENIEDQANDPKVKEDVTNRLI